MKKKQVHSYTGQPVKLHVLDLADLNRSGLDSMSDHYPGAVRDSIIKEIAEVYGVNQKTARLLFWNAIGRNVVNAEIFQMINYMVGIDDNFSPQFMGIDD